MINGNPLTLGGGEYSSIKVSGDIANTDTCYARMGSHWNNLPNGYTELEYIEGTGNQYIDTGYAFETNKNRLVYEFSLSEHTNGMYLCGSHNSSGGNASNNIHRGSSNYSLNIGSSLALYITFDINTRYTLDSTVNNGNFNISNGLGWGASGTYTGSPINGANFMLFGASLGSSTIGTSSKGKIYGCKMYDNDILVRNLIPCKNPSNVVGLYDKVGGLFYSSVTETPFIAGDAIIKKDAVWTSVPNPAYHNLPSGYTEVEYIQSSGTQYIDTGFASNSNISGKLICEFYDSNQYMLLGSRHISEYGGQISEIYRPFGSSSIQFDYSQDVSLNTEYTFEFTPNSLSINGVTKNSTSYSSSSNGNIILGAYDIGSSFVYSKSKFKYLYLSDGTNVREMIPCKRNSDNVYGMYDIVNNVFYDNDGTGTFTAGAEVPSTLDSWLIKKISQTGTWTVHWSDGQRVTERDVLIDTITEYTVEDIERLYLYNEGDECESVSGGWEYHNYAGSQGTASLTKNSDNLYLYSYNTNAFSNVYTLFPAMQTKNTIDNTNYSKAYFEVRKVSANALVRGIDTDNSHFTDSQATTETQIIEHSIYGSQSIFGVTATAASTWAVDASTYLYRAWLE